MLKRTIVAACAAGVLLIPAARAQASGLEKINHLIIIFQENWSFDGLYGSFPGANNIANAGTVMQVDRNGTALTTLPQPLVKGKPDTRFPANMPVAPFDLSQYVPPNDETGDITHLFYTEQLQIDGGKMDKFVTWSQNGGLVLSHYDATQLPEGKLAAEFTLADNFFHSAFGGSFLNHQWLICACTPVWRNAPAAVVSNPDPNALKDTEVTPDGYVVNTSFSVNNPHPSLASLQKVGFPPYLVPNQTAPTIGDRLTAANVPWAWYAGGWNDAIAGHPDDTFQFHHQAFAFYANYADGTPGRAQHLKDEQDFTSALASKTLPAVSFLELLGTDNEHPGYTSVMRGQQHVADIVNAVRSSPYWSDSVIIITYDEHGGRWDHVAPPKEDRWGPGSRVAAIVISPYARHHFVDHSLYETVSILKFIERRWNLTPLTTRDAQANDLSGAFDFTQPLTR